MSNGLSTTDIPQSEGGLPKTIQPGNCEAKINSIELDKVSFEGAPHDAVHLILHLETPKPEEGFVGFALDKDKPDGPHYEGQVARVKYSRWFFADGETKNGTPISRDREIIKALQQLCTELGITDWFRAQDKKYDTIEAFVNGMNKDKPYKGIFLNWCIAGREYTNNKNYIDHDKFLPKITRNGKPFESQEVEPQNSKLIKFDKADHIEKLKNAPVSNFGDEANAGTQEKAASDFNLDA